jgi:hypothetical protein
LKPNAALLTQRVSRREIFAARCQARAQLVAAGEMDLHDAVDGLQADAEVSGLVDELGQDEVQRIMGEAFVNADELEPVTESSSAEDAWSASGWREAALDYHKLRAERVLIVDPPDDLPANWDEMSVGALWDRLNDPRRHGVASSTLDAADYLLRSGTDEEWREWSYAHTAQERKAILEHVEARRLRRK